MTKCTLLSAADPRVSSTRSHVQAWSSDRPFASRPPHHLWADLGVISLTSRLGLDGAVVGVAETRTRRSSSWNGFLILRPPPRLRLPPVVPSSPCHTKRALAQKRPTSTDARSSQAVDRRQGSGSAEKRAEDGYVKQRCKATREGSSR